jgi:hypothetical protein
MTEVEALATFCAENDEALWKYVPQPGVAAELPEAQRLYTLNAEEIEQSKHVVGFQCVHEFAEEKRKQSGQPGDVEVSRFLRLIDVMHQVPWASANFDHNHRIILQLTASHLELLVGKKVARAHGPRLRALIGQHTKDSNLVWITNRQQGKTTSLAKFLACLSVAANRGGNLVGIYSTSLDRAQEVMRAAKAMIFWLLKGTKLSDLGYSGVSMLRDNEHAYVVRAGPVDNRVAARPKNVASCRGDAFAAIMVDEIAFIEQNFYEQFLRPLTQVGGRPFSYITTPAKPDSWFSNFVRLVRDANSRGDYHFWLISHSLVCQTCADLGIATRCCHNLSYIPPWKSLITLHQMLSLVPTSQRDTFQTEVLGLLQPKSNTYIDIRLLNALLEKEREPGGVPDRIYLAIDPASHTGSAMGLVAMCLGEHGEKVLLGAAEVTLRRADIIQCEMVLSAFIRNIRAIPGLDEAIITPIIECNNNEIAAAALRDCVFRFPPVHNWVTMQKSSMKNITPELGIWTTHGWSRPSPEIIPQLLMARQRTSRPELSRCSMRCSATR